LLINFGYWQYIWQQSVAAQPALLRQLGCSLKEISIIIYKYSESQIRSATLKKE
jgi:hypothetical protein